MKRHFLSALLFVTISQYELASQNYFDSRDEVIEYLTGTWNIYFISIQGSFIPVGPHWHGSVQLEFIQTDVDSFPLFCRSYVDFKLSDSSNVDIVIGFTHPWRLNYLPDPMLSGLEIIEDHNYYTKYKISQDSFTLAHTVLHGREFALSRTDSITIIDNEDTIAVSIVDCKGVTSTFPNPVTHNLLRYDTSAEVDIQSLRLYSMNGIQIIKQSLDATSRCVNVSGLSAGGYIAELLDNAGNRCFRKLLILN